MTVKKVSALISASILTLTLAACGDDADTASPQSATTETTESSTMSAMADPGEAVKGEIGKESGFDCVARGDCSVLFTVEAMDVLDECPGPVIGEPPAATHLVRVPVLIKTKQSDFDYNPGEFAIWSEWSAETSEGVNQTLEASSWCVNPGGETEWMKPIHVGDTVRHVHLMDVPEGVKSIRLTETLVGSRWEYPAPDVSGGRATAGSLASEPAARGGDAPAPTPPAPPATPPAPVPVPNAPAPAAPAPVIGFTGAPGVDTPRVLDKTIESCGDPMMHETGTTFFTDGTSGWTQQCADQMGY